MAASKPGPSSGEPDWEKEFRQNPDDRMGKVCRDPDCHHPGCHDPRQTSEGSLRVMAALITVEVEEVLALEAGMDLGA